MARHATGLDTGTARAIVGRANRDGARWQPPDVAADLLACFGVPVLAGRVANSAPAAVAAADALGYPTVLKAADPKLVHKSDIGGVTLSLPDADAVAAAYRAVTDATGTRAALVQRKTTVELVAGVVHDPLFGSLVMIGLGGVNTDLFADRALRLLPVTDTVAATMWRSLRTAPLLAGYRGGPAVDTQAVEDLLLRLGRLAESLPEVAELDLKPVLARPDGVVAVDVKLRLAPIGNEPDQRYGNCANPPEPARLLLGISDRSRVENADRCVGSLHDVADHPGTVAGSSSRRPGVLVEQPHPGGLQPVHDHLGEPDRQLEAQRGVALTQLANTGSVELDHRRDLRRAGGVVPAVRREQPRPAEHRAPAKAFHDHGAPPGNLGFERDTPLADQPEPFRLPALLEDPGAEGEHGLLRPRQ
jgi:hypothetical protein